jgi:hypothetical protein
MVAAQRTQGMSLNTIQPFHGLQNPTPVRNAGGEKGLPVAQSGGDVNDTVRLSDNGKLMSKLLNHQPSTKENVRQLSVTLASELTGLFRQNQVDTRREIDFDVNSLTRAVSVKNNRQDAQNIEAMVKNQPQITSQIQLITLLSRHILASERAADAQAANRVEQTAARIGSVIAAYAARSSEKSGPSDFSMLPDRPTLNTGETGSAVAKYAAIAGTAGAAADFSLRFVGSEVQVRENGIRWLSSGS